MRKTYQTIIAFAAACFGLASCVDTSQLESDLSRLEDKVAAMEETVVNVNDNTVTVYALYKSGLIIMDINAYDDGTVYRLDMSDGSTLDIHISEDGTGITPVMGVDENGNWIYSVDGGKNFQPVEGADNVAESTAFPELRVNGDGVWEMSTDGTSWTELTDADGNRVIANTGAFTNSFFSSVSYDEETGKLEIGLATGESLSLQVFQSLTMTVEDYTEGMSIFLGQELTMPVSFSSDVKDATIRTCPEGWRVQITEEGQMIVSAPATSVSTEPEKHNVEVWIMSDDPYIRKYKFAFTLVPEKFDPAACNAWNNFLAQSADNVLPDFSYAGYKYGVEAPPTVDVYETSPGEYATSLSGYKVYDVTDYGADGSDNVSDREAFMNAVAAAAGDFALTNDKSAYRTANPKNNGVNAVIYFPPGRYILHSEADNEDDGSDASPSKIIRVRGSNIVLKGAGMDQTTLVMQDPNLPKDEKVMYSSPTMLEFKHDSGPAKLTDVTADAPAGAFQVQVASTSGIKTGDWVCLWLKNNDSELIAQELYPYSAQSYMTDILNNGVQVMEYHRVAGISSNTLTFNEPIMKAVEAKWNWEIRTYPHYENIGIEDLTFEGNAKDRFDHHFSWEDDGAYKPVDMIRLTDSWMRRVRFTSVSEACSIVSCANVSAYDIEINGTRGHAAVRSQASSRVFIGAVTDNASGYAMDTEGHDVTGNFLDRAGQYHAVGVSKQSIGAVLWRNRWGDDSCFESHATQPRATLIDCCTGSMRRWRQGGDDAQMPNHMSDLVIWNFNNTTNFDYEGMDAFIWWDTSSRWWKILPPVIVGFHGNPIRFDESSEQVKYIESNGNPVSPGSLYEAQLEHRLGYVPGWLTALK